MIDSAQHGVSSDMKSAQHGASPLSSMGSGRRGSGCAQALEDKENEKRERQGSRWQKISVVLTQANGIVRLGYLSLIHI